MKGSARVIKDIRNVIALEAKALVRLESAVDGHYARAVEWALKCKGKVILTGVGKSGLIAQKIAATLSSTGTPALYLDPTDALHGSLGLIQRPDLVLAIGKSGESDELSGLLPNIRMIGAKLIAITANSKSTLARAADLVLLTPIEDEACPLNLAPTCSTTAALAAGDALAVALMKVRNFQAEHFARNHPGGRLGKRLNLTVSDIMRGGEDHPVVRVDATVSTMLVEITRKRAGAVNVVDRSGRLVGLVTDFDIRRALEKGKNVAHMSIRQIMNARPTAARETDKAGRAIDLMEKRSNPFNVLPVVDRRGRAVGMIQVHDLRARGL
ncbi:MAG: KpsF/GutQ family sugar-phosphate isomerase [Elusimicrobia bacterium]|nr:KpsF/GutQ family sugar-phosphate isomerase [Elusimicrobiota bacterium]